MLRPLIISNLLLLIAPACGTLIGNTGPLEVKSSSFTVAPLSKENPEWEKLVQKRGATPSTAVPDVAYQSKKTAAVISLTSACRSKSDSLGLRELSNPLFTGASEVERREERSFEIEGIPALEIIFEGRINNDRVWIRAVVSRHLKCVYYLLYVTRPEAAAEEEKTFARFVSSFRVR